MTSEGEGTDSMRGKAEGLILRYFDETLAVEYEAIRDRRNEKRRQRVADADSPIGPPRPLFKPGAIAEETLGETLKLRREARTTAQPTIPPPLPLELPPADDIRRGGTKTQGSSGIARWFTRTLRRSEDRMRPQP